MEQLIELLAKPDHRSRQDVLDQIVDQLNTGPDVRPDEAAALVDHIETWITSSNSKV